MVGASEVAEICRMRMDGQPGDSVQVGSMEFFWERGLKMTDNGRRTCAYVKHVHVEPPRVKFYGYKNYNEKDARIRKVEFLVQLIPWSDRADEGGDE